MGFNLPIISIALAAVFLLIAFWPRKNSNATLLEANDCLNRGNYIRGAKLYEKLLQETFKPGTEALEFSANYGRGTSLSGLGQYADAFPHLDRAAELIVEGEIKEEPEVYTCTWCEILVASAMLDRPDSMPPAFAQLETLLSGLKPTERERQLQLIRQFGQAAADRNQTELAGKFYGIVRGHLEKIALPDPDLQVLTELDIAQLHLIHGQLTAAGEVLQNVTDQNYVDLENDTLVHMWFVLATRARLLGDHAKEIECHEQIVRFHESADGDPELVNYSKMNLANSHCYRGEYTDCRRIVAEVQRKRKGMFPDPNFDWNYIPIWFIDGQYQRIDEVLEVLEAAPTESWNDGQRRVFQAVYRAYFFSVLGRRDLNCIFAKKARTICESLEMVREDPSLHLSCLAQEVEALCIAGKTVEAELLNSRLLDLFLKLEGLPALKCECRLASVWIALSRQESGEALRICEKIIDDFPDGYAAEYVMYAAFDGMRAKCLQGLDRHADANDAYAECEDGMLAVYPAEHPRYRWVYEGWAKSLAALGQEEEAREKLEKAKAIESKWADLVAHAGNRFEKRNDQAE